MITRTIKPSPKQELIELRQKVEQVFTDNEHRKWSETDEDYWFDSGTYADMTYIERVERDTLLVLEQCPVARREFILEFESIYDRHNPYSFIRWGRAFSWATQEFNGEWSCLYVESWALKYVVSALKIMAEQVAVRRKYTPRRM